MAKVKPEFISACIAMAHDSQHRKRHAAMVVKGRKVLGAGTNNTKTHPAGYENGQRSYHAEAVAMMRADRHRLNDDPEDSLKGATLYSFRNGPFKKSRPCGQCIEMAKLRGIRIIVYDQGPVDPEDEEIMMSEPGFVAHWHSEVLK